MLPASNRGAGMNMGFPDVCNTIVGPATVPLPYPNLAMNAQAVGFAPTVKVSMMNALNMASRISMTSGDEAGTAHPTIKGGASYTMGNPIVSINKLPAINLTCPTTGNNFNNPLGSVLVPSAVTVTYCFRAEEPALEALGAAMRGADVAGGPVEAGMLADDVGCVVVSVVTSDAATRVHAATRGLVARGARALVLDLRGCPGGDVEAALRVADGFVPRGTALVERHDPDGDVHPIAARQGDPEAAPLVLLVSSRTASAAEILAGSLQACGRALVVGATTYGKALATSAREGAGGAVEHRATAVYTLPGGRPIHGVGVAPDLRIDPTPDAEGSDTQLGAALLLAHALVERAGRQVAR